MDSDARRVILLVEDDPTFGSLIEFLLVRQGYQVHLAVDGEAALAELDKPLPDLVLMDVMLPYRDGYELLRAMRKRAAWSDVPVVILSGRGRDEDLARAFAAGANEYITKPIEVAELLASLQELLRPR